MRSASGAQRLFASEKATISPRARSTARSCAAALPLRGSSITASAPASCASSAVRSLEPSEATITSSSSRGYSSARALRTLPAITASSL